MMIGVSNITNRTDPNSLKSRVFVGNLNTVQMSKTELEGIFAKYGAVIGISVHKGYAFIQYANETSARAAVLGEDSKSYYNMALDVTIASEPKNRKRGRSNIAATSSACPSLTDLTLQAQALSTLANNPMISLQQLGLEGIMGQPNLAQFAAAASSVLSGAPFSGLNLSTPSTSLTTSRPKYNRLANPSTTSTTSMAQLSSSAKRTRLDGTSSSSTSFTNTTNSLPAGARGQNLVSLVSPADTKSQSRPSASPQKSDSSFSHARTNSNARSVFGDRLGSERMSVPPKTGATSSVKSLLRPSVASKSAQSTNLSVGSRIEKSTTGKQVSNRSQSEDILICGSCRRMFDQVDELISHKMAGCSLGKTTCEACRCRAGEPTNLECAYCGANFPCAWDLMHHCHNDHGLTIYSLPTESLTPTSSGRSNKADSAKTADSESDHSDMSRKDSNGRGSMTSTGKNTYPIPRKDNNPSTNSTDCDSQHRGAGSGVSDWEADDEYDEVAEVTEVAEGSPSRGDVGDNGHISESTVLVTRCSDEPRSLLPRTQHHSSESTVTSSGSRSPSNPGMKRSSSVELEEKCTDPGSNMKVDSVVIKSESPCHHRSRRGEYGRHETIADDEDESDEETGAGSKLARSG